MIIFISILQLHDNLYSQLPCHHVQVHQVPQLHMFSSVPVLAPTSPPSLAPACTPGTTVLPGTLTAYWGPGSPSLDLLTHPGYTVLTPLVFTVPGSCRCRQFYRQCLWQVVTLSGCRSHRLYQRCLESPGPGRGCVRRGAGRSGATPASTDIIKVKHSDPLTFLRSSQCPGKYW